MKGLLYKEYVSTGAKKILGLMGCLLVFFLCMRIALPGGDSRNLEETFEEMNSINLGEMYDSFLGSFAYVILVAGMLELVVVMKILSGNDRSRVIQSYYKAMPLPKASLIKAKYLFFLLADLLIMATAAMIAGIFLVGAGHNQFSEHMQLMLRMGGVFLGIPLLIGGIDFLAYLGFGRKVGEVRVLLILCPLGLFAAWFLFFGNLSALSNLNYNAILRWYRAHKGLVRALSVLFPLAALSWYYLSYRIVRKRELGRDGLSED